MRNDQVPIYKGARLDFWETPPEWTSWLIKNFGVNCDVCATHQNAICPRYFTEEEDCFKQEWPNCESDVCFMNPPFSEAAKFVKEAVWNATRRGVKLIILYKANMETAVWQDQLFEHAKYILVPRGRVNFCLNGEVASAVPFCTVFAFFNIPLTPEKYLILRQRGHILMKYPEIVDFSCLE